MQAFWLSAVMIFLAEMGDKTQLVALGLATRFNARVVIAGIFCATLFIHIFSAALGGLAGTLLPTNWIRFLAGLAFIAFGFWTIRGDSDEDECEKCSRTSSPFWLVFCTFFFAELGDKTMLGTVTLGAQHSFLPVWLGSTTGMVISDGIAIVIGQVLGARLPERIIQIGAACIFFAFGLFSGIQGAVKLPPYSWALGIILLTALAVFFLRKAPCDPETSSADEPVESAVAKH